MGVKEFLKPNKTKIPLFVVLLIVLIMSIFIGQSNLLDMATKQYTVDLIVLLLAFPAFLLPVAAQPITGYSIGILDIMIYIGIVLVWDYLLSCVIAFVYSKVKK